jgi:molecular chaperone GrpE (heat shock protein)
MEELKKRDARMEEADRATRSYFTGTLDKLREAITNELHVRAAQRLLVDVLPILNDLDDLLTRSEEAAQDERTARLWNALAAYRRRFYHGLRRLGLEEIRVVERETMFDPDLHECVEPREGEEFPDTEMVPHGAILKVCRKGYRFREELFHAPQVIIKQGEDHVSQGNWD